MKAIPRDKPVYVGTGTDIIDFEPIKAVTVILRTTGCHWRRCKMCNYYLEQAPPPLSEEDLISQIDHAISKFPEGDLIVKIFTSGSFFDEREIPRGVQESILRRLPRDQIRKLIIETRPEFVTRSAISTAVEIFDSFEVAIGLETTNDEIRSRCIEKGFSFEDFKRAVEVARACGAGVRTYLLLKPPYLTEREAIDDMLRSARDLIPYTRTISLNLTTVRKNTPLHSLWKEGYYRPPWLWSAVEVMRRIREDPRFDDIAIISDPIGAGKPWGPHNCKRCDNRVKDAIRRFSITQDVRDLTAIECRCKKLWEVVLQLERFTFGVPLP